MSKYIAISSSKRNILCGDYDALANTSGDYAIQWSNSYQLNKRKVKIKSIKITNSSFTINANNRNLDFFENAIAKTAQLTIGFYNAIDLATNIQTAINIASGGFNVYVVGYDANTGLMTFTAGNNFSLQFLTGANVGTYNNLWKLLGFTNALGSAPIDTTLGLTTSSVKIVSIYTNDFFKLSIAFNTNDNVQNCSEMIGDTTKVTAILPFIAPAISTTIMKEEDIGITFTSNVDDLKIVYIKIMDDFNRVIDFNNVENLIILEVLDN